MKKFLAAALALVMVVLLCACGGGSLVGKWAFGGNRYEFNADNSVSISINGVLNYDGTYEVSNDKITIKVTGLLGETTKELQYSLDGDTLKLDGDVTLTGTNMSLEFTRVKE